ncbi:EAL domain-containing protein [Rahnella sp. PCH160]|uniref:EAL domain-containing protein n=1 Tax=Rahnella sp. PCH160 TaxID=3447928 RepID=UPI0039FC305A
MKAKSIHAGLYRDEFSLLFQPIVDRSGLVIGAEALLRWEHPQKGTISPTDFITEAQEAGLMPLIGEWVVSQGLRDV